MAREILIILNNGPENPCRVTSAFLVAKGLVKEGHNVSIFLLNNAVYSMVQGTQEYIQTAGLPPFEDFSCPLSQLKRPQCI